MHRVNTGFLCCCEDKWLINILLLVRLIRRPDSSPVFISTGMVWFQECRLIVVSISG